MDIDLIGSDACKIIKIGSGKASDASLVYECINQVNCGWADNPDSWADALLIYSVKEKSGCVSLLIVITSNEADLVHNGLTPSSANPDQALNSKGSVSGREKRS
jgi:hypothetical protein